MKLRTIICSIFLMTILSSCGVPQAEFDKLKTELEELKTELEECKFGAEKIIAEVEKAYAEKKYSIARQNINMLYEKHPESPKNAEFKTLLTKIEKAELAEKKRKEAEEKERIRLENINNTGMWKVNFYVDDFGEPTKEGYIRNTSLISGFFSNTATQNSDLNVKFLISNSSDVDMMLYEYARQNPIKSSSSESYRVLIQDKDGERLKLRATSYGDRLSFSKTDSRKVHNILMKGGEIKFRIIENDRPTTNYKFTISKADWYENAYRKLKGN